MAAPLPLSAQQLAARPVAGPPAGACPAARLQAPGGAELAGLRDLGPPPACSRARPTDFAALPGVLHESIAGHLEPRDMARLAATDRSLYQTLQPKVATHRALVRCAPRVRAPEGVDVMLEAAKPLKDSPALMAAPLALMGQELARTPPDLRGRSCGKLLRAIEALPAQNRGEPLLSMAAQIAQLPKAEREAMFESVLRLAAPATPELLKALAGHVASLPAEARLRGFRRLLVAAAKHLPGQVAALLTPVIAQMPRGERPAALHELQQLAASLLPRPAG